MSHLNKKALGAGAAMVALSAFVPNLQVTDRLADLNLNLIGQAHAQATKTASLDFSAVVFNPLSISNPTAVNFGKFAIGGVGSITVKTGGSTSSAGQVVVTSGTNGVLALGAPKGATFSLSLTKFGAADIFLATAGGGGAGATPSKTMTVTTVKIAATTTNMATKIGVFSTANPAVTGYSIKTTAAASTGKANVGATLQIDGSEIPGTYTGSTVVVMSL